MQLVITNAGRTALAAAIAAGTSLTISHVAVGSGKYTAAASATALQSEIKQLTATGSQTGTGTLHITAIDDGTGSYSVGEIGLITSTGVLLAVYSQTSWIVQKASSADLVLALDLGMTAADATAITFGDTDFLLPAASNTKAGVVRLATSTEIDAGTAAAAVDAAQLQAWKGRIKTDSTTTNDSSKLATAAAVYALKQLITANTSAISTINSLLTSDNVNMDTLQEIVDVIEVAQSTLGSLAIANIAGLQTALDGKAKKDHLHSTADLPGLDEFFLKLPSVVGRREASDTNDVEHLFSSAFDLGYYDCKLTLSRIATGHTQFKIAQRASTTDDWSFLTSVASMRLWLLFVGPSDDGDELIPTTQYNAGAIDLYFETENSSDKDTGFNYLLHRAF